jgi:TPR repeat protein
MNKILATLLIGLMLTFGGGIVRAGPLEDAIAAAIAANERGDYATSLRLNLPLARQGNGLAQYYAGMIYLKGEGVPQNNTEAAKWLRLSADQGFSYAQFFLGLMYANGHGVPRNDAEAAKLYRFAAVQGMDGAPERVNDFETAQCGI